MKGIPRVGVGVGIHSDGHAGDSLLEFIEATSRKCANVCLLPKLHDHFALGCVAYGLVQARADVLDRLLLFAVLETVIQLPYRSSENVFERVVEMIVSLPLSDPTEEGSAGLGLRSPVVQAEHDEVEDGDESEVFVGEDHECRAEQEKQQNKLELPVRHERRGYEGVVE